MRNVILLSMIGVVGVAMAAPYASENDSREARFANPPGSTRLVPIRHWRAYSVTNGNGGTVINVGTTNYLRDAASFAAVKRTIGEMRALDLPVWIYDEDGYPSPAAGGLVVKDHPELKSRQYLVAVTNVPVECEVTLAPPPEKPIKTFAVKSPDGKTKTIYSVSESTTLDGTHVNSKCVGHDREYAYPNLLMKEATARFIELTHEAYRRELGDDFKYVTSFFTDEPSIMAFWHQPRPYYILPISDELLAAYRAAEGNELVDDVPYLIGGEPTGKTAAKRYRYWSMVGERMAENFTRQITRWCEQHGVLSGGHLFNEEGVAHHVGLYGDFFKVLRGMSAPGCDLLSSDAASVHWACSMLPASAGELNGSRRIMTETSAYVQKVRKRPDGSDWNLDGRDVVGTLNKQLWAGINTFTSYYNYQLQKVRLESGEEERINLELGRANTLLSESRSAAEIALLYPSSALMTGYEIAKCRGEGEHARKTANAFLLAGKLIYEASRYFLVVDEPTLAAAKVEGGVITDGVHRWRAVVLPGAETLPIEVVRKLAEFRRQGGVVLTAGAKPVNSTTAFPDAEVAQLTADWPNVLTADLPRVIADKVAPSVTVVEGEPCIRFARRQTAKGEAMFFVFNDRKVAWKGKIRLRDGGSVTVWDPRSGEQRAASGNIALDLPAYGAVVLTVDPGDFAGYVDVFTGTSATGHTTPAATTPFGMIQAGPDSSNGDWAYCSGYQYTDQTVMGYSQTHLSGTGCADMGDVQILPFTGEVGIRPMIRAVDKRLERGEPGYYTTVQYLDGIKVEITASKRVGFYRFTSLDGKPIKVAFNAYFGCLAGWGRDWYKDCDFHTDLSQNGRIRGRYTRSRWVQKRPVNYAIDFSRQWKSAQELPPLKHEQQGAYVLEFDESKELLVKVSISLDSSDKAAANIAAEVPAWDFDAVRAAAKASWNRLFARSTVKGDDLAMVNWYTSLYHLYFQPHDFSDAGEEPLYTTLSLWDTFRAAQPWYTIVTPEIVAPEINMMLKLWKKHGCLPRMSYGGGYVDCMIGEHSLAMIAEAYLKGIRGFDTAEALTAMTNTVTVPHKGRGKENWDLYAKYGYIPYDLVKSEGGSRVLETSYDDWCLSKFAEAIGNEAVAERFRKRSENWKNIFDTSVGFARGKDSKGNWREPFDPFAFGHETTVAADFTEGNSFQYSWHVLHDVPGLIAAMGGKEKFEANLDRLFTAPFKEGFRSLDITGLIGQYVHGNEPSHHIIYFYPQIGRPEKAAARIREVFDKFYFPGPYGLSGNDDCGQMSAWYVFSAMGFYPFNPVSCEYVIGAPQLERAVMTLPNGKTFTMIARGFSKANKFVKSVTLNGRSLTSWKVRHDEIVAGGELVFEMTDR